jgi:hypothetical protein
MLRSCRGAADPKLPDVKRGLVSVKRDLVQCQKRPDVMQDSIQHHGTIYHRGKAGYPVNEHRCS